MVKETWLDGHFGSESGDQHGIIKVTIWMIFMMLVDKLHNPLIPVKLKPLTSVYFLKVDAFQTFKVFL